MPGTIKQKPLISTNLILWLSSISLFAFLLVLMSTSQWGIGIFPDSLVYFKTADQLYQNTAVLFSDNIRDPNLLATHYPPLYPVFLSLPRLLFGQELTPRILHALFFAINAFLVGLCVRISVRNALFLPIACSVLFVFSDISLNLHTIAHSEPLFMVFTLSGFIFLALFSESDKWHCLLLSAFSLSLAVLTRYLGVVAIGTAVLYILLFYRKPIRKKLILSVAYLTASFIPIGLWLFRNYLVFGKFTSRELFSSFFLSRMIFFRDVLVFPGFFSGRGVVWVFFMVAHHLDTLSGILPVRISCVIIPACGNC